MLSSLIGLVVSVLAFSVFLALLIAVFPTPRRIRRAGERSDVRLTIGGVVLGFLYGLLIRYLAVAKDNDFLEVMTFSFIVVTPVVLGFLTVAVAEWNTPVTWRERIALPWASATLCLGATLLLAWEGLICIVIFLPLFLLLASIGGLFAGFIVLFKINPGSKRLFTFGFLLLPLTLAPMEARISPPKNFTEVETVTTIHAPVATVWEEIRSVRPFSEEEHGFSWIHLIGFPRPVSAEIDRDGVGAVRRAIFEGGLVFTETVTEWKENSALGFSIKANTEEIPPTTLDEHVTIGGAYFDVLTGRYLLEEKNLKETTLHLTSRFRTSTMFEPYTRLWAKLIMSELQRYIVERIKVRSEQPG